MDAHSNRVDGMTGTRKRLNQPNRNTVVTQRHHGSNPNLSGQRMDNDNRIEGRQQPRKRRSITTATMVAVLAVVVVFSWFLVSYEMQSMNWQTSSFAMDETLAAAATVEMEGSSSTVKEIQADMRMGVPGMDTATLPPTENILKGRKNRLVFHFGPPKTATTSLQQDLVELREKEILAEDHYWDSGILCSKDPFTAERLDLCSLNVAFHREAMLWAYTRYRKRMKRQQLLMNNHARADGTPAETSAPQPRSRSLPKIPSQLVETQRLLDAARQQNISLIYSSEYRGCRLNYGPAGLFQSPEYFANLQHLLRGWDVSIIVTYRRVFDWMISTSKQIFGMAIEYNRSASQWPRENGTMHGNAWSSIRAWMNISSHPYKGGPITMTISNNYIFMDGIISSWKQSNFPIHIMNFHDKRGISKQFLCDFIPDAPSSCEYLQQRKTTTHSNSRTMIFFMLNNIVFAAAQRGLISEAAQVNNTRLDTSIWLQNYFNDVLNKTMVDLPLDCPPNHELEELLEMSLEIEKKWMPEWYASLDGEVAHRKAFHRTAYVKREFCSVDEERLFEGVVTWGGLLEKLNRTWGVRWEAS